MTHEELYYALYYITVRWAHYTLATKWDPAFIWDQPIIQGNIIQLPLQAMYRLPYLVLLVQQEKLITNWSQWLVMSLCSTVTVLCCYISWLSTFIDKLWQTIFCLSISSQMWPNLPKPDIMTHFWKFRFLHQWVLYT